MEHFRDIFYNSIIFTYFICIKAKKRQINTIILDPENGMNISNRSDVSYCFNLDKLFNVSNQVILTSFLAKYKIPQWLFKDTLVHDILFAILYTNKNTFQ